MNTRAALLTVIAFALIVVLALAFFYPHRMLSPGSLEKGHGALTTDCFACHVPWRGARPEKCLECHVVADIGLRTTVGAPIANAKVKSSFHQSLIEQDCMACHAEHQGAGSAGRGHNGFSHALLKASVRDTCSSCHAAPVDRVHRPLKVECGQCHRNDAWAPAHFEHALLAPAQLEQCASCHDAPADRLHRQVQGSCHTCHTTAAWKPATFDHDKYFVLDHDHDTNCSTCHRGNDYRRHTCYGCHEHTEASVRAEHLEEGIRNIERCVECHRDPRVEPEHEGRHGSDSVNDD